MRKLKSLVPYILVLALYTIYYPCLHAKTTAKKTNDPAQVLQNAVNAFNDYDFEEAEDLIDQYKKLQAKAKKNTSDITEWENKLQTAVNAFDRVQQIVVIDSISMPRASFFRAYKLAESAGKIGRAADFKIPGQGGNEEVSFLSEGKDYFITTVPAEDDEMVLMESRRLLDGSWETQEALEGDFEKDGDYAFPFMSGDGQTLYFANNGEGSMGGYDLFVVQKEPITGECLQPLNLGMPFNSPYDDFMMAIDEETGLGWWATDRNSPGEDITVYVYILDDVRKNYPSDTPDLERLAKISNYKATWNEGEEAKYERLLQKIQKI